MLQVFVGFDDLVAVLRTTAATAVPTVKQEALTRLGFEDAALFLLCFENRVLDEKLRLCDVPVPRNATLHHHAHNEPSAAEPSAQMTRRHTMGLLREGTMKQQLPSSKGGRYG